MVSVRSHKNRAKMAKILGRKQKHLKQIVYDVIQNLNIIVWICSHIHSGNGLHGRTS